jgi:hypothetical protein
MVLPNTPLAGQHPPGGDAPPLANAGCRKIERPAVAEGHWDAAWDWQWGRCLFLSRQHRMMSPPTSQGADGDPAETRWESSAEMPE